MTNIQDTFYTEDMDRHSGASHWSYWPLYDLLTTTIWRELTGVAQSGLPLTVLEIGAGHGGFTEPTLAFGCDVTAVEMSTTSIAELERRFGQNSHFKAIFDADGDLAGLTGTYSLVLCVSVLHHIPDYMASLELARKFLAPGGSLVTLQDPLWYDRMPKRAFRLNRFGYTLWRTHQGNLLGGLATRVRRMRGVIDEDNPADMVEYHVIRKGVDEEAIWAFAKARFDDSRLLRYWSNQSGLIQRLGDRMHMTNTFGVIATGYHP